MNGAQQNEMFRALLDRMGAVRKAKNKDYANEKDSLANFRMVEAMGMPAWIGILIRLGDKVARAQEQARKVLAGEELTFAVTDEGFDDLCVDGANYFLLMNVAFQEWVMDRKSVGPPPPETVPGDNIPLTERSDSYSEYEVEQTEKRIEHLRSLLQNPRWHTFAEGKFQGRPIPYTVRA